jgi:hypothetical protein
MIFHEQTSLLIQKNGDDTYLVAIGVKTFEGTDVSVNVKVGDTYVMGFDNPSLFEMYEDIVFNVDIEVEPDESLSVDVEIL